MKRALILLGLGALCFLSGCNGMQAMGNANGFADGFQRGLYHQPMPRQTFCRTTFIGNQAYTNCN